MPLKRLLIERTEGNPFFLEESVRTLVETGVLVGTPGAYRLAHDVTTFQVPATVQAVLAARIDRLSPEDKSLLQSAAVIGKDVPAALLQAIAEGPEATLHQSLSRLQAAEFLYETRLFPEPEYTFKHALTHETAYGSLLQERRRVLHAHIVDAMATLYADHLAEQVERLAHHALRGEVWAKALMDASRAGRRLWRGQPTARRWGIRAGAQCPCASARDRNTREQAIELRFALRPALLPSGDFGRVLVVRARPRPLRKPSTIRVDWDRSLPFWQTIFILWARMTKPSPPPARPHACHGQRGCCPARAGKPLPRLRLLGSGRLSSGDRLLRADRRVRRKGAVL